MSTDDLKPIREQPNRYDIQCDSKLLDALEESFFDHVLEYPQHPETAKVPGKYALIQLAISATELACQLTTKESNNNKAPFYPTRDSIVLDAAAPKPKPVDERMSTSLY